MLNCSNGGNFMTHKSAIQQEDAKQNKTKVFQNGCKTVNLSGSECGAVKTQHIHNMNVV